MISAKADDDVAPQAPQATPEKAIKTAKGFRTELLYSVPSEKQGSWVCITADPKGRLIVSDQYGKLYRVTVPPPGAAKIAEKPHASPKIEPINVDIGMAQGLLCAFDSLYVVVNGRGPGLYRVRDTNGDDQYDQVQKLRALRGGGEHGPHAVILSPDRESLYIAAGNHTNLTEISQSRVPQTWQEDQLLPRMWDAGGHAVGRLAPAGWICRTDPDGKRFELVSNGFRNEYDIAFNLQGELFTYDADMEWDVGLPWYRPTRVLHVTSGSEFGWRSGTGKWPSFYPDNLPSAVDIGPGSPTGIVFGTGAKFPAKYQRALLIADWSYGVIYAVHLKPQGSTYVGEAEPFVGAAPLPVTDMVVNPRDGALYFTIGGRRTQSGLYRVTYVGDQSTAPIKASQVEDRGAAKLRDLRRRLEQFHGKKHPQAVAAAWPYLSHPDRFIRFAARIAIEHQPLGAWKRKALSEPNPQARILAAAALARTADAQMQKPLLASLLELDFPKLKESEKLDLLRAYGLALIRLGDLDPSQRLQLIEELSPLYPASSPQLNQELCRVLVFLEAPDVIQRTLKLLEQAPTQEEQIHYALCLRTLKSGWRLVQRRRYFEWFPKTSSHRGGHSFTGFLRNIRKEAAATLSSEEKKALGELITAPLEPADPLAELKPRKFVKKWTTQDLLAVVEAGLKGRNFEHGRRLFAVAACFKCHRFAGRGGMTGPDLTGAARRFNSLNLLEAIIEPSKTISDQYQSTQFILVSGRSVVGRVANLFGNNLMVAADMLDPGKLTAVRRDQIELMQPSPLSPMPDGLLDTLNKKEALDLIAYLQSGGDPKHQVIKNQEFKGFGMNTHRISRRTVLRGLGVTMALPWMESRRVWGDEPQGARKAQSGLGQAPTRMAILFAGCGFHKHQWWAKGEGQSMELGKVLWPVRDFRDRMVFIRGLYNAEALKGNIHSSQTGNLLSGAPLASGGEIRSGTSVDQVVAKRIGRQTKLPSLVLGCEKPNPSVHKNYSMLYSSHISWSSPTTPTPLEVYPALAFDQLFKDRAGQGDKSVLDAVLEDAADFRRHVSRLDQQKLDEYLNSVREVEQRIQWAGQRGELQGWRPNLSKPNIPRPKDGYPQDIVEHMRLMCDILVLAFQTDTTRVCTLKLNNDHGTLRFPHLGVDYMIHHLLSHSDTDDWLKVNQFFLEQLAYIARRLDAIQEGDRSLLDNSMLMLCSSMLTGHHDATQLPVVMLGQAGGRIQGGRVLNYLGKPDRQMCRLYLNMMEKMGAPLHRFGDANQPLDEV